MTSRSVRNGFKGFLISAFALGVCAQAQDTRSDPNARVPLSTTTSRPTGAAARAPGRGTLPDPALLDGSTQPAEKKSENGMLGDFELPGNDDVRNGKVGGPQQQMPQGGGGQPPMGMPQAGGSGGQPPQGQQAGGGGPPPPSGQQPSQSGGAPGGPSDPNAKAEGTQVASLQTDPNAGAGGSDGTESAQKPPQVSIGDSAMQIKGVSNPASVVGAQMPAGSTQQMEKNIGSGKGSTGGSGRNASEKGRAMPSGL